MLDSAVYVWGCSSNIQLYVNKLLLLVFLDGFTDDFSRVKLSKIQGEEGSDYINASFVDVRIYNYYEYSGNRE